MPTTHTADSGDQLRPIRGELRNFLSGFQSKELWLYLTDQSISSRFRGSYLGAWWLIVSQLAFAGVAGTIWSMIFNLDAGQFVPFIAISFAIWGFISGCLVDACASLVISSGYLRQMSLPLSLFIFRSFLAHCFYLLIGVTVGFVLMLCFRRPISFGMFWFFPGLALDMFTMFWLSVIFAFIGARFRDVTHGVANILQVMYVVTPVIYPPTFLIKRGYGIFVHGNPLAGLMEVLRHPLTDGALADWQYYAMVGSIGVIAMIISVILVSRWGRRVVYWL